MSKTNKWFGPVGGILFVAAVLVGNGIFDELDVDPSDSASAVLEQFRVNSDNIQLAGFITVLGLGFLLVFVGHLRNRLREGGAGWAADGFLAGGVAVVAGWLVLIGVQMAGAVAGENGHSEVAQAANDFLWNSMFLFSPGLLAVGIAVAAASFISRTLPIWLGVFGVVVALGSLAPWLGVFVFVLWVLAASIVELIGVFRPATPTDVS